MKIEVTDRDGRVRLMNEKVARLLQKTGRITYLTRDMQAGGLTVDVPVLLPAEVEPEVQVAPEVPTEPETVAPFVQDEPEAPAEQAEPEEAPKRRVRLTRKAQAEE